MDNIDSIIKNVVNRVKKEIAKADVSEMDGLCIYASNNISYDLASQGVANLVLDISDMIFIPYSHQFVVAKTLEGPAIYYLIDMTYSQFMPKENQKLLMFDNWPSEELKKSVRGEQLLETLLNEGYTEVDDSLLELYLKSFDPKAEMVFSLNDLFITKIR